MDERRESTGRRDYDHGVDWILSRFDRVHDRIASERERVAAELDSIEREVAELERRFESRVDALELFRTEETARARLKMVDRTEKLEGRQRAQAWLGVGIAAGALIVSVVTFVLTH